MANPYLPPSNQLPTIADGQIETAAKSMSPAQHGLIYALLFPAAAGYTLVARSFAGPSFTTAPNQGAMLVFLLFCVAWPVVGIAVFAIIRHFSRVRGTLASAIGVISWLYSCFIPYWMNLN